jgi:DNA polymerase III delta subunit
MRSSTGPSRAGRARGGSSAGTGSAGLLERFQAGDFPATLYVEGPSEPLKAALLGELKAAWAASCPESPRARVLRAAESGVEEILAAYQGGSLFSPRELTLVLEVEDLGRSEKKIGVLAAGLARPAGGSSLVLVESAAENERKTLEPLRSACAVRWSAQPPGRRELVVWATLRLARLELEAEAGLLEALADASEGDPLVFFSELGKLETLAPAGAQRGPSAPGTGGRGSVGRAELALLLRPAVGADLPDYLAAVAMGDRARAARSLGRLLATGISEGTVLFALTNLVGGALGAWSRNRELSEALRRRRPAQELAGALDALYRAEAAWKGGRADVVAVLEQATHAVAGGRPAATL